MGNYQSSVPAATAVVGADLFAGEVWARSEVDRTLNGYGLLGSAAAGDTEVELFIGEVRVSNYFNVTTGFPTLDHMFPLEDLMVPSGAQLRCIVRDAAATNPANSLIGIEDLE